MSGTPMTLSAVAERLDRAGLLIEAPTPDVELRGITDDSRSAADDYLFCAWKGTTSDAHDHAPAAMAAGASALLVERRLPSLDIPQMVVVDGRRATAVAAQHMYGEPATSLRLVGITGTNGKTTTAGILRHLLGVDDGAASIGTLGTVLPDGSVLPGSEALTTPGPVDLARLLRELVDRGVRSVAMEVSSHALHQGRVAGVRFDAAVFTNLSRDHLDYHGTLEAYLEAKLSLLDLLHPDGVAAINADDPAWNGITGRARRSLRFRIGELPASHDEIVAGELTLDAFGAHFVMASATAASHVDLPLLGAYNVQNALGAAAACVALGMDVPMIADRLATLPQVAGRLERIADWPCAVLRDYAHTPDALERALGALRPLAEGRLIVVFGAGGDRDRGKRPLMGAIAAAGADIAIVTSDNPRTEDPDAIIDEIVAGMSGQTPIRILNRREAIARALGLAGRDDIVLLAGKGHETYQVLGSEKVQFDEREIVLEWQSAHTRGE